MNLPSLGAEKHITVTADSSVTRPLIAWKSHEPAILLMIRRQFIKERPERVVNLKIVCLMTSEIEERFVPSKIEIRLRRANTYRLTALPV